MRQSTTIEPVAQITGRPMVCLVDIHGDPVPDAERYTPTCPPDPDDPAEWPESNEVDGWFWCTSDPEGDVWPIDLAVAIAALEDLAVIEPEDDEDLGPDAPDADPSLHFAGIASVAERMALPPIAGGAPDYTDADYEDWLDSIDRDYPPDDRAEPGDRDWDAMYADRSGSHASPCGSWD